MEVLGMKYEIWIERESGRNCKVFSSTEATEIVREWNRIVSESPAPEDRFLHLKADGWTDLRSNHGGRWVQ